MVRLHISDEHAPRHTIILQMLTICSATTQSFGVLYPRHHLGVMRIDIVASPLRRKC
jgi:hypothetical protein